MKNSGSGVQSEVRDSVVSGDWQNQFTHSVSCPVCTGECIGESGSYSHFETIRVDNLTDIVVFHDDDSTRVPSSERKNLFPGSMVRGSSVGFTCWFETCAHIIEYRFQFHKGDVYLHWRLIDAIDEGVDPTYRCEMPRT